MGSAIIYEYPFVRLSTGGSGKTQKKYYEGRIRPLQFDHEPYEMSLEACGYYFHLIFGRQINGHFLCIPNWQFGCELANLDNISWNTDALTRDKSRLKSQCVAAIVWALSEVSDLLH